MELVPLKLNVESFLVSPKIPVNKLAPDSFSQRFFMFIQLFSIIFQVLLIAEINLSLSLTPNTGIFAPKAPVQALQMRAIFVRSFTFSLALQAVLNGLVDVSGTSISSALSGPYEASIDYYFLFYFFGKFGGINFLSSFFNPTNASSLWSKGFAKGEI